MRGLYLFEYSHFANFDLAIGADVGEYNTRAEEILKGIIFPQTPEIHAPLYSFFLALLKKLSFSIPAIRIFQTLLNYFAWLGLFFLLWKKNLPEKLCFIFLGSSMILAPLIFHPAELISEALLLPLFAVIFTFLHLQESENKAKQNIFSTFSGIFTGFALLTHGMLTGFLFLFPLALLIQKKWRSTLFFLLGSCLVILPFIAAKSAHYGKLSGLQSNTGFNIYLGNNPHSTGLCCIRPGNLWRKTHFQARQNAEKQGISTDRYFLDKSLAFWQQKPLKAAGLWLKKIPLIFSGRDYISGADGGFLFCRSSVTNNLRCLTWPLFLLAFYGIFRLFKEKKFLWLPPLILTLSLFLMQLATVTSGRYRLLMFPGLIYLAAVGANHINWKKWGIPFIFLIFFSFASNYGFMSRDKVEGTALLGQAHFIKGDHEHAKELLLYARYRFRDASRIDNMLGNIAEKEGDFALARQYYQGVAKKEPFMPEGWMNLANMTTEPRKAEEFFKKALEVSGTTPSADLIYNYAKFLYASKNLLEADKFLTAHAPSDSNHLMTLNLRGVIAADKKDFKAASELFFKAAQLQPDEPGFWKNTAITARLAGNKALEQYAAEKFMLLTRKK